MRSGAFCHPAWEFCNRGGGGGGRKGTKSVSAATKWMCIIRKYAWRRKSDGKVSRRHKKGNVEEEAWENKAWEGGGSESRGMENRKRVVHRRFERAHHFYREGGERRGGGGGRGEGGGGRGGDASLIRRRRGNEKWGIDGARRGRK